MKEKVGVRVIATMLQRELDTRFEKVLQPSSASFDPIYLESTLLDPRYRILLSPEQLQAAKSQVLREVSIILLLSPSLCIRARAHTHTHSHTHTHTHTFTYYYCYYPQCGDRSTDELGSSSHGSDRPPEAEPCFKRFKYLSSMVSDKLKEQGASRASPHYSPQEEQLESYLRDNTMIDEKVDAIDYWLQNNEKYPDIAPIALDILVIPASSTPIERVFSTAGIVSGGRRNRLSAKRLEREVLIKKNKSFLSLHAYTFTYCLPSVSREKLKNKSFL